MIARVEDRGMRRVVVLCSALAMALVHPAVAAGWQPPSHVAGSTGGDGGEALRAGLRTPTGLAVAASGDLIIADAYHHGLRRVRGGVIANAVDDTMPFDVAVGADGTIIWSVLRLQYVGPPLFGVPMYWPAELYRLLPGGSPERIAGDGVCGHTADGALAAGARVCPFAVAVAPDGTVAFAEPEGVRAIGLDGALRTLARVGSTSPSLGAVGGIAYDSSGVLYVADPEHHRILKIAPDGTPSFVGEVGVEDVHAGTRALTAPVDVAVAPDDILYALDRGAEASYPLRYQGRRIVRIDATTGRPVPLAAVDDASAITASDDAVYVSTILTYFAPHEGSAYARTRAHVHAVDRRTGVRRLVAGSGVCCYAGDGGPAVHAELGDVRSVAVAGDGAIWIGEEEYDLLRRIDVDGTIRHVAGNDSDSQSGRCCLPDVDAPDPLPAAFRSIDGPRDLARDGAGRVYLLEATGRVLEFDPTTGLSRHIPNLVDVIALGDDARGRIYVANESEETGAVVSRLDTSTGTRTPVAGGRACDGDDDGDGVPALDASFCGVSGIVGDGDGNLYIAEQTRHRVRRIAPDGMVSTIAGDGTSVGTGTGDGGPAVSASIPSPRTLRIDAAGNLYVQSARLRVVRSGVVETVLDQRVPFAVTPDGAVVYATVSLHVDIDHAHGSSTLWRLDPVGP